MDEPFLPEWFWDNITKDAPPTPETVSEQERIRLLRHLAKINRFAAAYGPPPSLLNQPNSIGVTVSPTGRLLSSNQAPAIDVTSIGPVPAGYTQPPRGSRAHLFADEFSPSPMVMVPAFKLPADPVDPTRPVIHIPLDYAKAELLVMAAASQTPPEGSPVHDPQSPPLVPGMEHPHRPE